MARSAGGLPKSFGDPTGLSGGRSEVVPNLVAQHRFTLFVFSAGVAVPGRLVQPLDLEDAGQVPEVRRAARAPPNPRHTDREQTRSWG